MTLIKSISGIRGTIGGHAGEGLNPLDIVKFTSAYATLIRKTSSVKSNKIVVGRDARISGEVSIDTIRKDIIRSTRQYAKRQMTFFSSFATCRFFHPDDIDSIRSYLSLNGIALG